VSSDERRAYWRVRDMLEAISDIRALLDGRTFDAMHRDKNVRAAFERYLQVLTEASLHIPDQWKLDADPTIAWNDIRNLGNLLRHAYQRIDHHILWDVYENDLDALEIALDKMIVLHGDEK
jgi:uncharacterized protein with HEPN domain